MCYFDRYSITPENDMNFGALLVNSKKTRFFVIENKSEKFDLKYTIMKAVKTEKKLCLPSETKHAKG